MIGQSCSLKKKESVEHKLLWYLFKSVNPS